VGPQSAGADPAPACYGKGGKEPTSTDADLILGYLNPEYFLGGEMDIDIELSQKAIKEKVSEPLGMSVIEGAVAIRKIIDHQMADAISRVSVERGEDPRKYALVAAGGAGPLHVSNLAKTLEVTKILIPRNSSVFCALGGVIADIKHDLVTSITSKTNEIEPEMLSNAFRSLEKQGNTYLEREGIPEKDRYYERSIDMRYKGQFHEVEVPISSGEIDKEQINEMVEDFNKRHEELYAYKDDVETEIINIRLSACGKVVAPSRKKSEFISKDPSKYLKNYRDVYFEEAKAFLKTPIYDGNNLECGNQINGPAIIEQDMTNIVTPPGAKLEVTEYKDFLMILE
jgi:N-methylhydantoinase A